ICQGFGVYGDQLVQSTCHLADKHYTGGYGDDTVQRRVEVEDMPESDALFQRDRTRFGLAGHEMPVLDEVRGPGEGGGGDLLGAGRGQPAPDGDDRGEELGESARVVRRRRGDPLPRPEHAV